MCAAHLHAYRKNGKQSRRPAVYVVNPPRRAEKRKNQTRGYDGLRDMQRKPRESE